MIKWFRNKDDYSGYKKSLASCFPIELKEHMVNVFSKIPFNQTNTTNFYNQQYEVSNLLSQDSFEVNINSEKCQIPYRVYFDEPLNDDRLSPIQNDILNCIYTRHHNGRVRQKALENLSERNSYWITPFRVQLLGEYVYEIIETLSNQLNNSAKDNCKRFLAENPKIAKRTKDRITSYYDAYYRWQHPNFKDYLGKNIFDQIAQKYIGLDQEEISQIGIDEQNRLFLKTKERSFSMIYRLAKGINWDNELKRLITSPIKEWSKYKWYLHILNTIYNECNIELIPTRKTEYINLDRKSINQIKQNKKRPHNKV